MRGKKTTKMNPDKVMVEGGTREGNGAGTGNIKGVINTINLMGIGHR